MIKVYKEYDYEDLMSFKFWSGACANVKILNEDDFKAIEDYLEEIQPDEGYTETNINDFFWFEDDIIANVCGYDNFEEMWNDRHKTD